MNVSDPTGNYALYFGDGQEWTRVSIFDIEDADKTYMITVSSYDAQSIKYAAVVPLDPEKQGCEFELYVSDIVI